MKNVHIDHLQTLVGVKLILHIDYQVMMCVCLVTYLPTLPKEAASVDIFSHCTC